MECVNFLLKAASLFFFDADLKNLVFGGGRRRAIKKGPERRGFKGGVFLLAVLKYNSMGESGEGFAAKRAGRPFKAG